MEIFEKVIIKSQISFLKSVLYLAAVVECGSVTKAAEQNGIKQTNLSRMIKDLEETLATSLFVRKSNGMVPTETAMVLYRHALDLQKNLSQVQAIRPKSANKKRFVRLYKPDSLSFSFLKEFSNALVKSVKEDEFFNVGIFYFKPNLSSEDYQVGEYELKNGAATQKLWIACQTNNPMAFSLTDFIISRLFV